MADAPDVKIKITAEDQGVAAAIKQLTSQLQTLKEQEKETADASFSLKDAFTGVLEVLAVEKLVEFGKEVFDTTTKILKLSQVTGLSTETISVYAAAAMDAGVSFDVVAGGISKLAVVVTQFEQGNQRAAKSIALTGLSLKSLTGLNAEDKLRAITDAIGKMPPGFAKQTVETKLLGDNTGSLTRVLNSLAGDGFEKTREEAERLGNIVGTQTALDFEALRASLADLKEESEGIVRQFEAGMVPALTDITNAILRATTTDGVSGFKTFGQFAGDTLKQIILLFTAFFGGLEKLIAGPTDLIFNLGRAAADALSVGPVQALKNLKAYEAASEASINGIVDAQLTAVQTEFDGSTRLQEEAIAKLKSARDKAKGSGAPIQNEEEIKGLLKLAAQQDSAYKTHTASLNRALQAEEEISKSFRSTREEEAKSEFDRGLISLTDYYDLRRLEIESAGREELQALQDQRANEVKADERATRELAGNRGKSQKAGGVDTIVGQEYQAAAARNLADQQRARQAIGDLDKKIAVETNANKTKLIAEDLSRFKTEAEQLTKLAAFQKTILDIQGKTGEAAKVEASAKEAEYRLLLASTKGETAETIETKVKAYHDLTAAAGDFEDTKKAGEAALKTLADSRANIEDQVKSGKIFQLQADEQIEDLEKAQLATLQEIAAAQLKAATATGNKANIAQAKDFQRQVDTIAIEANAAQKNAAQLKEGIQAALVGSFQNFFDTGITGARNVAQAFAGLADGIIGSLKKVATQMLTNIIMTRLFKSIMGGAAGGGASPVASLFMGFAEGGIVSGPGSATSDSIPARLSAGEFVFREAAVKAIGPEVLAAMNRGMRAPAFARATVPHFAEGGLVEGAGKGGETARVHLQLGLEEGIVLKHMSSRAAGKVVIEHIANNPKQASKAIGRST